MIILKGRRKGELTKEVTHTGVMSRVKIEIKINHDGGMVDTCTYSLKPSVAVKMNPNLFVYIKNECMGTM